MSNIRNFLFQFTKSLRPIPTALAKFFAPPVPMLYPVEWSTIIRIRKSCSGQLFRSDPDPMDANATTATTASSASPGAPTQESTTLKSSESTDPECFPLIVRQEKKF